MTALSVRIETKRYIGAATGTARLAIQQLGFTAAQHEFLAVLGPSGCGKTTLLNIIAGLDAEYDGQVQRPEGRLAYVFQTPRLLPWRSVLDNIVLAAGPASLSHARDLLDQVGIADYADAFPGELSIGMQRRAALARAFAVRPALLLMDEPFVSLDEPTAERLRTLLYDLWRARPTTVLFVTHDSREAIRLAQRVLVLAPAPTRVLRAVAVPLGDAARGDARAVEAMRATLLDDDTARALTSRL